MMDRAILQDLAMRWRFARRAALKGSLAPEEHDADRSEDDMVRAAMARDPALTQRAVFENSKRLGRGLAAVLGRDVAVAELDSILAELGVECAKRACQPSADETGVMLHRRPCQAKGASWCDYWSEAIHGLVLGLTGGAFFSRHASAGHSERGCVDAVYLDPKSPLRFGPLPEELVGPLTNIIDRARVFNSSKAVRILGLCERTLFIEASGGTDGLDVVAMVTRDVNRVFPNYRVVDATPAAVLSRPTLNPPQHPFAR